MCTCVCACTRARMFIVHECECVDMGLLTWDRISHWTRISLRFWGVDQAYKDLFCNFVIVTWVQVHMFYGACVAICTEDDFQEPGLSSENQIQVLRPVHWVLSLQMHLSSLYNDFFRNRPSLQWSFTTHSHCSTWRVFQHRLATADSSRGYVWSMLGQRNIWSVWRFEQIQPHTCHVSVRFTKLKTGQRAGKRWNDFEIFKQDYWGELRLCFPCLSDSGGCVCVEKDSTAGGGSLGPWMSSMWFTKHSLLSCRLNLVLMRGKYALLLHKAAKVWGIL